MVAGAHDQLNVRSGPRSRRRGASDVVLFLVDVEEGVHPRTWNRQYLRKVRARDPVANKATATKDTRHLAFYELGLGDPFRVRRGREELGRPVDRIVELLPRRRRRRGRDHVAVVGRPKWEVSLVNACSAKSGWS